MDTPPGKCWRCLKPAKVWCTSCQLAQYCSISCANLDKPHHADECNLASWGLGPCAYCGKQENHPYKCDHCGSAMYCSPSCLFMDDKNHKPTCVDIQNKMLSMARSIRNLRAETEKDVTPCTRSDRSVAGWGFPALDILQASRNEWRMRKGCAAIKAFSALIFGGEFKHVLATIAGLTPNPTEAVSGNRAGDGPPILTLFVAEDDPEILARLVVLVNLLEQPNVLPATIVKIMYYSHLGIQERRDFVEAVQAVIHEIIHESRLTKDERRFFDKGTSAGLLSVLKGWQALMADSPEVDEIHSRLSEAMKLVVGSDDGHTARLSDYLNRLPLEPLRRGMLRHLLDKTYTDGEVLPVRVNATLLVNTSLQKDQKKARSGKENQFGGHLFEFADDNLELIFEDWLPDEKSMPRNLSEEEREKDAGIGAAYERMLSGIIEKARQKLKSVKMVFLLYSFEETLLVLSGRRFDRILTGPDHADRLGTPFLINACSNMINISNPKARLITFHSLWSQFLVKNLDGEGTKKTDIHPGRSKNSSIHWRDGCGGYPEDQPVPLFKVVAKIAGTYAEVLKQFLRAELLQHRVQYLGRKMTLSSLPKFNDVLRGQALQLVPFMEGGNTIAPTKLRRDGREICNFDQDRIALEWTIAELTYTSATPATRSYSSATDNSSLPPVRNAYFSLVPTDGRPSRPASIDHSVTRIGRASSSDVEGRRGRISSASSVMSTQARPGFIDQSVSRLGRTSSSDVEGRRARIALASSVTNTQARPASTDHSITRLGRTSSSDVDGRRARISSTSSLTNTTSIERPSRLSRLQRQDRVQPTSTPPPLPRRLQAEALYENLSTPRRTLSTDNDEVVLRRKPTGTEGTLRPATVTMGHLPTLRTSERSSINLERPLRRSLSRESPKIVGVRQKVTQL